MHFTTQSPHAIRFEWGIHGVSHVANGGGVTIIVDVLSFSTCVDIVCSRNARVLPYRHKDASAAAFASAHNAVLAGGRSDGGLSLSPQSLLEIEAGTRLVLPSPNGSTLTLACTTPVVLAGCLRNAAAVAAFASRHPGPVTVVAAGERWEDGTLRPAVEDLLGAGAVIHHLQGARSPEAAVAEAAFVGARSQLASILGSCASAVELVGRGFADDVRLASALNTSTCVPQLNDGAYSRAEG
jgi:2-phosphosulfolactate phosphatase